MNLDNASQTWWSAPAKLNLLLHITGRRPDGYHNLQSVFQLTDFCDYLRFSPNLESKVTLTGGLPGLPEDEDLAVRAAKALREKAGNKQLGVSIELTKNIPAGAGLGGGSSDAATALLVLNKLWDINFPILQLAELGLALGADVPVFINGYSAWAEGVGEKLTNLSLPASSYVIVTPTSYINTGEIFSQQNLQRNTRLSTPQDFDFSQKKMPGQNDCEGIVKKLDKDVCKVAEVMAEFAPVRLTGTGSSLFLRFFDHQQAEQIASQLERKFSVKQVRNIAVCKGLNQSPLLAELER